MKMTRQRDVGLIAGMLCFAWFTPALAQTQNCLKVNCPPAGAPFVVPCEGPYGAVNWFAELTAAITAGNPCSPNNAPVVISTSGYPINMPIPIGGLETACITYGIPGTIITQVCCVEITVAGCCSTNCVELVCPGDTVVPCDSAVGGAMVDLSKPPYIPVLTNLCGGTVPSNYTVAIFPPVNGPTLLTPGPHTFSACLQDTVTPRRQCCCFTIVVAGPACPPPTTTTANCDDILICPTNVVVCVGANTSGGSVPLQYPTVTNFCGRVLNITPIYSSVPAGYIYPLGRTTVTTCVRWIDDVANEVATNCCCYDVDVRCCTNSPPCQTVIDCPGDQTFGCSPNGVVLSYNVFATNPCQPIVLVCDPPPGTRIFGTTNVCCFAEDPSSGRVLTQCCFTVYVQPCPSNCAPTFNCPSNIFIPCSGPRGSVVYYPPVSVVDPCDPVPHVAFNPPSGTFFPPGCWPVNVTAWDYLGHTNSCIFKVCVLTNLCYLRNPSFEYIIANPQPSAFCGEPVDDAVAWSTLAGAPKLFRPPLAVPVNCWGDLSPCNGTNYAGLSGGYDPSGTFSTDQMIGQLVVPLVPNGIYRLRACLSLAQSSTGQLMVVEFVLANRAAPALQHVINQSFVTTRGAWQYIAPPCFKVPPATLPWDALIIRASQITTATGFKYPIGQVYVDNVNICCCRLIVINPFPTPVLTWTGLGTLQFLPTLGPSNLWANLGSQFSADPMTDLRALTLDPSLLNASPSGFFELVAPEGDTTDCGCYP